MVDPERADPRQRVTIADVAALAEVSTKTVSRVLNGEGSVRQDTVDRVWAAAAQLRYRRNEEAANLRRGGQASLLGLVLDDLADPVSAGIARAAEEIGRQHGYVLIVAMSGQDTDRERTVVQALCRRGVTGLLVLPSGADLSFLRTEIAAGRPVVFVDRPPPNVRADSVVIAHAHGAGAAVTQLVEGGHQRIAYLGGPAGSFASGERRRGYEEALVTAGIPVEPSLMRLDQHTAGDGAAAVLALLQLADPPTAVFAGSTPLTIGAVLAIRASAAPVDVVGFDELGVADLLPLPLTVVAQDADAVGRTATELLIRRIDGDRRPAAHVSLDTELVRHGNREAPA